MQVASGHEIDNHEMRKPLTVLVEESPSALHSSFGSSIAFALWSLWRLKVSVYFRVCV